MIYSTGIDLVEIDRFREGHRRFGERYLQRLFSDAEAALIRKRPLAMPATMAGKFAAKEAVIKCLGAFIDHGVSFRDIEILNEPSGQPYVHLAEPIERQLAGKRILISISHERLYAVAVAIICDEE
jgi:holo-[acyl-carrier protein] synthase